MTFWEESCTASGVGDVGRLLDGKWGGKATPMRTLALPQQDTVTISPPRLPFSAPGFAMHVLLGYTGSKYLLESTLAYQEERPVRTQNCECKTPTTPVEEQSTAFALPGNHSKL